MKQALLYDLLAAAGMLLAVFGGAALIAQWWH
jgi:hypothetical protein